MFAAATLAFVMLPSRTAAAPPNDNFPGATISSLPFKDTVDTAGATDEPGEHFCLANEGLAVWYSYTPSADTVLVADVEGSQYPVFVSAWTGTSLLDLTCGPEGDPRALVFQAAAGVTYYLQVGSVSYPPQTGTLTFNLSQGVAPPNDRFPGTTLIGLPFRDTVDTTFATVELSDATMFGAAVWYNYTPGQDMTLVADTLGSDFQTQIAVDTTDELQYPGGSLGEFTECGQALRVVFEATAGTTYYFHVGGRGFPGETGTLVFNLAEVPAGGQPEPDVRCEPTPTPPPVSDVYFGADDFGAAPDAAEPAAFPAAGASASFSHNWIWAAIILGVALTVVATGALILRARRSERSRYNRPA